MTSATQRWRLDIGYDGTDFRGWASQPNLRTVQGELEGWLTRLLRRPDPVQLTVAGRTDAGVHARAQVAHLDVALDCEPSPADLAPRLRRVLPHDVAVRSVTAVGDDFDARFSALWRRYCYRVWDDCSEPDPIRRRDVATIRGTLDLTSVNAAGASLLGLRDFAPFSKHREGATTIRQLTALHAARLHDECGTVVFTVQADAFTHSMVRSLVGALTAVGTGRRDQAWLDRVAAHPVRHSEVLVMVAGGLTLEAVGYPADHQLAARARQARSLRTLPDPQQPERPREAGQR